MYINFSWALEKRYIFLTWKENEINKQLDNPTEKVLKQLKKNVALHNREFFLTQVKAWLFPRLSLLLQKLVFVTWLSEYKGDVSYFFLNLSNSGFKGIDNYVGRSMEVTERSLSWWCVKALTTNADYLTRVKAQYKWAG